MVSWGIFQAAACGARLLVNDFPGLDEVFAQGPEFPPVDLDDQNMVTSRLLDLLNSNPQRRNTISLLADRLDLYSTIKKWVDLLGAE